MKTNYIVPLLLVAMGVVHAQGADVPRSVAIPAGKLSQALEKLGAQTGVQIMYEPSMADGVKVEAVSGTFTVGDALAQLLAKTGLKADRVDAKTVVLKRAEKSSDASPAGLMRVANAGDAGDGESSKEEDKGSEDVRQVVVKDKKIRPYSDANVDLPRTINDARPYYIFDSETIERSAALNIEDFLKQRLTMNTSVQTAAQFGGSADMSDASKAATTIVGRGNTSEINLRGLGADKTLILINGRRRAGVFKAEFENLQQTNINGIPMSAVDRIEVLPTSASGIYGGSAIGGVINIVLKKDYEGGDLQVSYDTPADTDAPRRMVSGRYGFGLEGGRTNVTLSGSFSDSKGMYLQDRLDIYLKNRDTVLRNDPSRAVTIDTPFNSAIGLIPVRLGAAVNILGVDALTRPTNLILKTNSQSLGTPYTHLSPGISSATPRSELEAALRNNAGGYDMRMPPTAQVNGLLNPLDMDTKVKTVQLAAERRMFSWLDGYAEFSRSENVGTGDGMDRSGLGGYFAALLVPSSAPGSPFATNVYVAVPIPPDGNPNHDRNYKSRYTNTQVVAGLQLHLPWEWSAQLDYQWSENRQDVSYMDVDRTELRRRIRASEVNVFVDTVQYPLQFDDLWYPAEHHGKNTLSTLALRGTGNAFPLPWGMARLAMGLEHNSSRIAAQTIQRQLPFTPVAGQFNDLIGNFTYHYYPKNQTADSLYAELEVPLIAPARYPLLHSLSLQLTGRTDRSEIDAGTQGEYYESTNTTPAYIGETVNGQPYFSRESYRSTNYTVGLKYQPVSWLTLRASGATAFLPIIPAQLQRTPLDEVIFVYDDPVKGLTPNVRGILFGSGNPNLKPQSSRSFNAGLILEPDLSALKGLRLNLECYSIKQFDVIDSFLAFSGFAEFESLFPERVVRDSAGLVTLIDRSLMNLYERDTAGMDVSLVYDFNTAKGRFILRATESIMSRLKTQYSASQPAYDAASYAPAEGGGPKHKRNATLSWAMKSWNIDWTMTYAGSYKQYGAAGGPVSEQFNNGAVYQNYVRAQGSDTVASQTYHDLWMSHSFTTGWLNGMNVTAGIKNVFSKTPPFDVYYSGFNVSPFGDMRLRSYWLSLKRSF